MSEEVLTAPPMMYEHCLRVYNAFDEEAKTENVNIMDGEPVAMKVWTGATTKVFQKLGLATPYYSSVMQHLKRMGCVEQYRRGGGATMSKWILHLEPTPDLYENTEAIGSNKSNHTRLEQVEQQIKDLNKKINLVAKAAGISF
jgi:hypothetical protein